LADISKINAVALANIAKLDAVLAANIAKVNGLVFTAAAGEFLLDNYTGAAAGYSVRRLATSATVLLRVRRDTAGGTGDDDEADVAYDSNNIVSLDSAISNTTSSATTLGQFLNVGTVGGTTYTNPDSLSGTASCFVDEWKDQSGNANHASQATFAKQPQIHSGTVNTDLITENGKPALDFNGSGDNLQYTGNFLGGSAATGVSVSSFDNATRAAREIMWGAQDSTSARYDFLITRQASNAASGTTQNGIDIYVEGDFSPPNNPNVGTITDTNQHLYTAIYSDTVRRIVYNNGSTLTTSSQTSLGNLDDATAFLIGADISGGTNSIDGKMQEIVIWNADQEADSNRSAIEENINSEYLIYQPTDAPTSGLLATYSGAAAAYSVRQLADTAVIAITVRRDSDDEEKRFGFDANGDLDTAGITSFCGTANGYVSQWWDQSTNGNHAEQGTQGSQPQIYNGTAVITENGKPALDFDGINDVLPASIGTMTHPFTVFTAAQVTYNAVTFPYMYGTAGGGLSGHGINSATEDRLYAGGSLTNSNFVETQTLFTDLFNGSSSVMRADGAQQATGNVGSNNLTGLNIAQLAGYTGSSNGELKMQEIVLWNSDQTSNFTGIETNINTYFSIY